MSTKQVEVEGQKSNIEKRIANIMDVEVTGYEVVESEAKQATPASAKAPAEGATKPTTPAGSAQPGAEAPASPPQPSPKDTSKQKKTTGP